MGDREQVFDETMGPLIVMGHSHGPPKAKVKLSTRLPRVSVTTGP